MRTLFLSSYGVVILRVFIVNVIVQPNKYEGYDYWIKGQLESGLEIFIHDTYYDLERNVGTHVEMLLSFFRSPYVEVKRGIDQRLFKAFEYYSIELIDELKKNLNVKSSNNERVVILTGEYIDSYTIPAHWIPKITRRIYRKIYKEPHALKTEDGIYLLDPWHMEKRIPLEKFPPRVTMGGSVSLVAWSPL